MKKQLHKNYFENKVAVVTGGASGIGKATVEAFVRRGVNVAVIDVNSQAAKSMVKSINDAGGFAVYFECDLTQEVAIRETMNEIADKFGRIDFAYNNAGIGGEFAKIEDYPTSDWDKVMAINLRSVFLCMKYEIPFILKQGGAIVNCASVLSSVAYENDSAYVASKFGVLGLTKNAALEYANTGLRINSISPGFTQTPMVDKGDMDKLSKLAGKHPIGRLAQPGEIAEGVIWLCSDASSFAIGLDLRIDGGYTLL